MHEPALQPFLNLLEGYLAGGLDETQRAELVEWLRRDAQARRIYLEHMDLNAELHWRLQSRQGVASDAAAERGGEMCAAGPSSSVPATRGRKAGGASVPWLRRTALCAALVALTLAGAFWWKWGTRKRSETALGPQAIPTTVTTTVSGVVPVRIDGAETREISLGDKGYMFVQGPADLELVGTMRARLHRGRIRVRITSASGHGFTVETPRGNVTDLGTEFGVDVGSDADTGVVVFEGEIEMALGECADPARRRVQRLEEGDGVVIGDSGKEGRLESIVTGTGKTFQRQEDPAPNNAARVIENVWDNIPVSQSRKVYQIVPGGLDEDAICYVDRPRHEWNGLDGRGMPADLKGADYVKTINDFKIRKDVRIFVKLAQPARLYVFLDSRVAPPRWLRTSFRNTGAQIGMDEGPQKLRKNVYSTLERGVGPGQSIDQRFSVWERVVDQPGEIQLGPNLGKTAETAMYGIAAVALKAPLATTRPAGK